MAARTRSLSLSLEITLQGDVIYCSQYELKLARFRVGYSSSSIASSRGREYWVVHRGSCSSVWCQESGLLYIAMAVVRRLRGEASLRNDCLTYHTKPWIQKFAHGMCCIGCILKIGVTNPSRSHLGSFTSWVEWCTPPPTSHVFIRT